MQSTLFLEPFDKEPNREGGSRSAMFAEVAPQGRGVTFNGVRARDLIIARWLIIAVEAIGLYGFSEAWKFAIPVACLSVVIGLSVVVNTAASLLGRARSSTTVELAGYLIFDSLQLALMIVFCGGSANPFSLSLIFPARMAASILPPRTAFFVLFVILLLCVALVITPYPLPQPPGFHLDLPVQYRIACGLADGVGICFGFGFGWWSARQAARMEFALRLTDTFLARQQRLSALGGLAAAAAHELGTPLTTISVVAKEMAREAPEGPLREDAWLLVEQSGRCREILRRLSQKPDSPDALHSRVDLAALVEELAEPFAGRHSPSVTTSLTGPRGQRPPVLWRLAEVHPALSSILENAADFGRDQVRVIGRYDSRFVSVEVRDDGPGFEQEILARLGEPYLTRRGDAEPIRGGHVGMGLGIFIAKTLLERTGARVTFHNARPRGAVVTARWWRAHIEASPSVDDETA